MVGPSGKGGQITYDTYTLYMLLFLALLVYCHVQFARENALST